MISRFRFNILIYESFLNIFKIFFYKNKKEKDHEKNLKNELSKIYKNSSFYFFDHGRTAFYETLLQIKKKTNKRKILVNSLTLFEIINVIIYAGFEPVFVDNKKNSFETEITLNNININLNEIAVIVVTHLNGANPNILNLKIQVSEYNKKNDKIYLVEDCAVALGAKIDNDNVGLFGDYSFISFNIMKNITSYTGGVLIDNIKEISNADLQNYRKSSKIDIFKKIVFVFIIQLVNTKILFPIFLKIVNLSYKYSFNFFLKKYRTDFQIKIEKKFPSKFSCLMHPFQKKILLSQFKDFEKKQIERNEKSKIYYEGLKDLNYIYFPQIIFDQRNIFLEFPIICETKKIKEKLFNYLMDRKIDIKGYYYQNCSDDKIYKTSDICINARVISENIIMLPVHEGINIDYQNHIINEIKYFKSKYF